MKTHTLLRNTKALSPVIATIILVAVTVAIAIAVAAWLGALTFQYTNVEQLNITGATITAGNVAGSPGTVLFSISNSGTSDVIIASASVTGGTYKSGSGTFTTSTGSTGCTVASQQATIPKGGACSLTTTFAQASASFIAGTSYSFQLLTTKGHTFPYTTTA